MNEQWPNLRRLGLGLLLQALQLVRSERVPEDVLRGLALFCWMEERLTWGFHDTKFLRALSISVKLKFH